LGGWLVLLCLSYRALAWGWIACQYKNSGSRVSIRIPVDFRILVLY
jgi:hypothetical protein